MKTQHKTQQILRILHILAWVAAIGFAIEAGTILVSFVVSLINPESARDMQGHDLYNLSQFNRWYYAASVSFIFAIVAMKSYMWFLVINTLSAIRLQNPFTMEVAQRLEKISYVLFGIWLVGIFAAAHGKWLMKLSWDFHPDAVSGEFIFVAGIVFIVSQIFKRGVEIQTENELTV